MAYNNSNFSTEPFTQTVTQTAFESTTLNISGSITVTYDYPGGFITFLLVSSLMCIIFASFLGNCLIFLIAYKKPALLTIGNRYILHLAVCQFIMTVLVMPWTFVSVIAKDWVFSDGWCAFTAFAKSLLLTSIILTLLLVSFERYVSITRPMAYHRSVVVNYWFVFLVGVWLVAISIAIPPILGWSHIIYSKYQYACSVTPKGAGFGYILFLFFLGFLFPFLTMSFIYLKIFVEAKRLIERMHPKRDNDVESSQPMKESTPSKEDSTPSKEKEEKNKEKWVLDEKRIANTGIVVIASYAVCWVPVFMVMLFHLEGTQRRWWVTLSSWMAMASCAINPYVYVFRSRTMRKQASLLLARFIRRDLFELNSDSLTGQLDKGNTSIKDKKRGSKGRYKNVPSFKSQNSRKESGPNTDTLQTTMSSKSSSFSGSRSGMQDVAV
ncbi:hypothetical protein HOLleu_11545 [Holothuria leucospilota]|uniref:G-protein coupled receptors family 1 profile domain-containing protein n=1 Tax=Holothuria leucospilota TaxID=206669 RepID=A0A9Q1HGI2_HOLLE|nr:hypothetical protein HOLleu_11545 [Holothuria leucospilota]